MAIELRKGQTINLAKETYDLSKVTLGLGWKVRERGFWAKFLGNEGDEYDLDAIAFLLNKEGKLSTQDLRDVIFFNNKRHASGSIWSCGDNLVGGNGASDDEQIVCLLDKVPAYVHKILFLVSIYKGQERHQCFKNVSGAYIRAVDAKDVEMARFSLSNDAESQDAQSVIFAELNRVNSGWKFSAIGEPRKTASFVDVLKDYL